MALKKCRECGKEVSSQAQACPGCGIKSPSQAHIGCIPSLIVIVFVLWGIGKLTGTNITLPDAQSPPPVDKKAAALGLVKVDYKWSKGGFGNVMEADFTINNLSDYDVKDVEITCYHYASSNTMIDKNARIIYEVIKKHDKKQIKNFNMGFIHSQTKSSSCQATDLSLTM